MYRKFHGCHYKDIMESIINDHAYGPWASFSLTKECSALCVGDRMFSSIAGDFLKYGLTPESIIVAIHGSLWAKTFDIIVPDNRIGRDRLITKYKKMSIKVYTDNHCIDSIIIDNNYYKAFAK